MNKLKKSLLITSIVGVMSTMNCIDGKPKEVIENTNKGVSLEFILDSDYNLDISEKELEFSRGRIEDIFLDRGASCAGAVSICYAETFRGRKLFGLLGPHYNGKNKGVYGDAWHMRNNILDNGGELLISGDYDDYKDLPSDLIESGDILGIYYSNSNFKKVAKETLGKDYYTHVGIVVGETGEGEPVMVHYRNQKLIVLPINELIGERNYSLKEVFRAK